MQENRSLREECKEIAGALWSLLQGADQACQSILYSDRSTSGQIRHVAEAVERAATRARSRLGEIELDLIPIRLDGLGGMFSDDQPTAHHALVASAEDLAQRLRSAARYRVWEAAQDEESREVLEEMRAEILRGCDVLSRRLMRDLVAEQSLAPDVRRSSETMPKHNSDATADLHAAALTLDDDERSALDVIRRNPGISTRGIADTASSSNPRNKTMPREVAARVAKSLEAKQLVENRASTKARGQSRQWFPTSRAPTDHE